MNLTTAQIRDHLTRRRRYIPGWEFDVYEGRFEGTHLAIIADLPDAYNEGQTTKVRIENMLPPFRTYDALDEWMVWRLTRIASHEVREFYRTNRGHPVFDPHAEAAHRDLAREEPS